MSEDLDDEISASLDPQSNANWFEVRLEGKVPERRGYHSTFVYGSKMYIYGGHDIREGSMDNLWMIDLEDFNDLDMQPEDQERILEWHLVQTTAASKGNKRPGAISHHTSVVYGERMYMFGGSKASGIENNEFWALNIEKLSW